MVPEFAASNFMLRCRDKEYLKEVVVEKVRQVAEGAAQIAGARLEIEPFYPLYENVRPNASLARAARANAETVGVRIDGPAPGRRGSGASTDFGNVSQVVPSFAMSFAISQEPVPGHSKEMCVAAACTEMAHASAIDVAKTLALTACELLAAPDLLESARAEFAERGK